MNVQPFPARSSAETLRAHARASLALGDVELSINVIETWCAVFAEMGDHARAAALLGTTTTLRAKAEIPIAATDAALLEASIGKVRDLPDPGTWAATVSRGSDFALDDALVHALEVP